MVSQKNTSALSSPITASIAAVFGRFLLLGTGALTGILLPLSMAQETVGLFFLSQSVIAALATFGQLGLSITAPACISTAIGQNDVGRVKQIIRRSSTLGLFSAILLALTFSVFMHIFSNYQGAELVGLLQQLAPLISISMVLAASATILSEQHRALGHFVQASFLTTGSSLASAATVILAWQSKSTLHLDNLLLAGVIGAGCGAAIGGYTLWRWHRKQQAQISSAITYKEILLQTRPNLTTTAVLFVMAQADLWIIAYFGDTAGLAVYGLASRLASLVLIPLAVVNTVIAPSIGRIWVRDKKRYLQRVLGIGAGAATSLAIFGYLLFILIGKYLLATIWSDEYSEAYYIFAILGASQIVQTYAGTAGFVLMMLQKQHIAMRISVGSGVLMIISGFFAMSQFGIIGLAVVYSLGSILQSVLLIYYVKRIFGLNTTANYSHFRQFAGLYFRKKVHHGR